MTHRNKTIPLIVLVALAALCGMRATAQSIKSIKDGINYQTLTEQIEIMRRVWTRSLSDRFAELIKEDEKNNKDESKDGDEANDGEAAANAAAPISTARAPRDSDGFTTTWQNQVAAIAGAQGDYNFSYSATSETRGLYLPGHGVVYSTDIQVPLRAMSPDEAKDKDDHTDAWEEARTLVRGNGDATIYTLTTGANRRGRNNAVYAMDERYIDAAEDSILANIAKYGSHIDQLPAGESITVAVRLNPGGRSLLFYSGMRSYVNTLAGNDDEVGRLVIEVPHSVLGKDLDAAQLKSQCKITRY